MTGTFGLTTNPLPHNWVGVTFFPKPVGAWHDDDTEEYTGLLLHEDDDVLVVEIFDEPMTFSKDNYIVRRSVHDEHENRSV